MLELKSSQRHPPRPKELGETEVKSSKKTDANFAAAKTINMNDVLEIDNSDLKMRNS